MGNLATTVSKPFEELEFRDDFMFGKTMEDPELCHDVIECLLQRPVGELHVVQGQKEFRFVSDGKPIRLDVYNMDSEGSVYDAEMQNLNRKKISSLALPRRSRFYQSSIDIDHLDKGNHYRTLPDCNIMFICTFDPFGLGLAWYTFRERCDESSELVLADGTEKNFYNCTYAGEGVPDEIQAFYEYVRTGRAGNQLTRRIDEAVERGRRNENWRSSYMKERIIIMDAIEEERENTERERARADRAEERVNAEAEKAKAEAERADRAEERVNAEAERADRAEERVRELEKLLAAKEHVNA